MAKMSEKEYVEKMTNFLKGTFEARFADKFEEGPCPDCGGRYVHMCEKMLKIMFGVAIERTLKDTKDWPEDGAEVGLFKF